jgi:hypothetical protein
MISFRILLADAGRRLLPGRRDAQLFVSRGADSSPIVRVRERLCGARHEAQVGSHVTRCGADLPRRPTTARRDARGHPGHVMVNRGAGYEFARGSVEVVPGDMIIANAGGNAQLIFVAAASWWTRALSLPLGKARRAPAGTMLEHSALLPPRSLLVPWRLAAVLVPLCCSARVATSLRAHRGAWRHNGTGQSTTWH